MSLLILIYLIFRIVLTLIGFLLLVKERNKILLFKKEYFEFLMVKWKVVLFLIATLGLSYISTLGLDPSWDIPETIIMSILTFYTSPFVIGTIYRFYKGINRDFKKLYISFILLFFCSAWFYDIYAMIFLLGFYLPMAFANLGLSPFFYILSGIMWNLDYKRDDGVVFAYTKTEWINFIGDKNSFNRIFIYIIPIILFMIVVFGTFILQNY